MMGAMGMMLMIAALVGSQSATVGFVVHMVISIFMGVTFGTLFGNQIKNYATRQGLTLSMEESVGYLGHYC